MKNTKIIAIILCFIFLSLTACNTNNNTINGKYISLYSASSWIEFNKNGSLLSSNWTTKENDEYISEDCFTYTIDDNGLITAIDNTEYEGQLSPTTYEVGYLYKDYICYKYDGELPIEKTSTTVTSNLLGDIHFCFIFNKDNTYEYTVVSNNQIVSAEYGTYSIDGNKVVCISEDNIVTTFFNTDVGVLCIEYIKA